MAESAGSPNVCIGEIDAGTRLTGQGDDDSVVQHLARCHVKLLGHGVPGLPEVLDHLKPGTGGDLADSRGATPAVRIGGTHGGRGRCGHLDQVLEFLACPLLFARILQVAPHLDPQLVEQLDVQGRIGEEVLGQWPLRPVGGGVFLEQMHPAVAFHHVTQSHLGQSQQTPGEFGVEECGGAKAFQCEARDVLDGGMQYPLGAGQCLCQILQSDTGRAVIKGGGVDEVGPAAVASQLDEVGPRPVPEPVGTFGVDGHGSGAMTQGRDGTCQGLGGVDDWCQGFGGFAENGQSGIRVDVMTRHVMRRHGRIRRETCCICSHSPGSSGRDGDDAVWNGLDPAGEAQQVLPRHEMIDDVMGLLDVGGP